MPKDFEPFEAKVIATKEQLHSIGIDSLFTGEILCVMRPAKDGIYWSVRDGDGHVWMMNEEYLERLHDET